MVVEEKMIDWKTIVVIVLSTIIIGGIIYYMTRPSYPFIVNIYKYRYSQMSTLEMRESLIDYSKNVLNDSIVGLNWYELAGWEHRYLHYTSGNLANPRPELPIPILERGLGRCGEFVLLYTGLCLTNDIPVRLVIDCSAKTDNRTTADHVWNEVYVNGRWVHIDPTEKRINDPYMYVRDWDKNVNLVYAITDSEIIDVTDTYRLPF